MKPKKILYLMHIDWHWIKQRPHFLAEGLADHFEILVIYPYNINKSQKIFNVTNISKLPLFFIPFSRFKIIAKANQHIRSIYTILLILLYNPDIIWFTFPSIIPSYGIKFLKNKQVIYDCMDDALEFTQDLNEKKDLLNKEQLLINTSSRIFASSSSLCNKLSSRGAPLDRISLVRNAYNGSLVEIDNYSKNNSIFRILYIGTISDYIDFNLIISCLENIENLEFHFAGPLLIPLPNRPGIIYCGLLKHDMLYDYALKFDCLFMPFVVTELIKSVDPVKLYEYINFNKNIICPYYEELERFSEFVMFYRSEFDLYSIINQLKITNDVKFSNEQRIDFLKGNSWDIRVRQICEVLN